jgi:molecular chaperone GrpE
MTKKPKREQGNGAVDATAADAVAAESGPVPVSEDVTDPVEAAQALPEVAAEGDESVAAIDRLESELTGARDELDRTMDQFRRLAADFDNYRKRIERERVETYGRAQAEVVKRLLDVVDDLERVASFGDETSSSALLEGVRLVERKLRHVLTAAGLEVIDPQGLPFDPTTMEGLATAPTDQPEDDDLVSDVFVKGYRFKGQLIRPARVRVKKFEA